MKFIRVGSLVAFVIAIVATAGTGPVAAKTTPPPLCVNVGGSDGCFATIQAAVNAASTGTTINVSGGTYIENVTINPLTGTKAKKLTLTIAGTGTGSTIVDGGGLSSVFNVGDKTTLILMGLTIQDGDAGAGDGGAIFSTDSAVTIINCLITANVANQGGGIAIDGGSLTIDSSTINANTTAGDAVQGGGVFFDTGTKAGKLTITNSTISGNTAFQGGGVFAANPVGTIFDATISGNTAPADLSGNGGSGAGVFVDGGKVSILNSTISGNSAEAGSSSGSAGGGIENDAGKVTLNNATIADNSAGTGGGIDTGGGRSFKSSNSIISNNTGTALDNDCAGTIDSKGFNLILDTTGCTFTGKTSTDIIGVDPLLQALALNPSGTTETQALSAGSPALTKGNSATPNGKGIHCFATGQNGIARPKGACDIGAFQLSL